MYDSNSSYSLPEAVKLSKATSKTKFDASIDLAVRLGVDGKKNDQVVRGSASLPNGTGKQVRVLVLCTPDKEKEAKEAGADHVGLNDYISKIEKGWTDIEVIVTMPQVMPKLGKLGKILGPKGLMPNPKIGTVSTDIAKAVKEVKAGKIELKADKFGIVHASVGRVSFSVKQLEENAQEILKTLLRLKPNAAKGTYIKSISMSNTMGPGLSVDKSQWSGS